MSTEAKHSPLPWRIENDRRLEVKDATGRLLFDSFCNYTDAQLIITAVNSHAHLVESNRRLIEACELILKYFSANSIDAVRMSEEVIIKASKAMIIAKSQLVKEIE